MRKLAQRKYPQQEKGRSLDKISCLRERTLDGIRDLFRQNIRGIRRTGGAALDLSWVACGRFEGFFEYELAPWDYAAGALIVTEAGGRCTDRAGEPLSLNSRNIVAATRHIHAPFLATVRWQHDPTRSARP